MERLGTAVAVGPGTIATTGGPDVLRLVGLTPPAPRVLDSFAITVETDTLARLVAEGRPLVLRLELFDGPVAGGHTFPGYDRGTIRIVAAHDGAEDGPTSSRPAARRTAP